VPADTGRSPEQARVFGQVADLYDRSRPGYPAAAVQWLTGCEPSRVLDLGAGTGKLTAGLVAAGHDVVAVEPDSRMLQALRAALPGVDARLGAAEAIPLPSSAVDVVTVAQAFHWFDHDAALPEIARVVRPGGRLAVVWNMRDPAAAWMAELSRLIRSDDAVPIDVVRPDFGASDFFGEVEESTFAHSQLLDLDGLLGLVRSRSYIVVLPRDEQTTILTDVTRLYHRNAESAGLEVPYRTQCYRAQRSPASFQPRPRG
jgi:ubiquinone/menaquinone biosynthesis C-methylase UbiE